MGISKEQLVQALAITKDYSNEELAAAEKRTSALIQALYDVFTEESDAPLHILKDNVGLQDTPIGHVMAFMGTKCPRHYLICDGAEYAINDYPALTQHMVNQFGAVNYFGGDGETTFAVPDLRNEFLRGFHGESDQTLSGEIGMHQVATTHASVQCNANGMFFYTHIDTSTGQNAKIKNADSKSPASTNAHFICKSSNTRETATDSGLINYTSRPMNVAVLYCIKYEPTYYIRAGANADYLSEEETCIGTWIDGRPLYRKVLAITSKNDVNIPTGIEDIGDIVLIDGYLIQGDAATLPNGFWYSSTYNISMRYIRAANAVCVQCASAYNGYPVYVILRYTKTTDTHCQCVSVNNLIRLPSLTSEHYTA
ncbi:MAG: phage tail protein [Lachnospiraceae bacterium]|nr:phage tail protein [Lachnospiraceae bacterium]